MEEGVEKIKRFFYKNPNSRIHLRRLARSIELSPAFVSTHIDGLVEGEIVKEEREGNMRIFFANTSSPKYRMNKKAYNLKEILTSDLVPFLEENMYPDCLVLFGSYLRAADTEESDIDIAVINGRDISLDLSDFEQNFERMIKLTMVDGLEEAESEFIETLINGLVLSGYLEVPQIEGDR